MLWTSPSAEPGRVAVVCHPHPLFQGTFHNKVVFQTAKALHAHGMPVLRFNFRGAGLSEGTHDNGIGEGGDVTAALDFLAQEFPQTPILLAGFSFGASVGLRVGCEDSRVDELIGLGIPVNHFDLAYLRSCPKRKLIVQGSQDEFGSRDKVQAFFNTLPEPKQFIFVDGADHFFAGKLDQVVRGIGEWLNSR